MNTRSYIKKLFKLKKNYLFNKKGNLRTYYWLLWKYERKIYNWKNKFRKNYEKTRIINNKSRKWIGIIIRITQAKLNNFYEEYFYDFYFSY